MAHDTRQDRDPDRAIADLATASREDLRRIWTGLFDSPVPAAISQPLLRRILAFEIQLRAAGGWPPGLERRLRRPAARMPRPVSAAPKPGGRLLRDWNGTTHVVEIDADGYLWDGRRWSSLSAIARAITGAHWSGPRFFGLGRAAGRGTGAGA